MYSQNPYLCSYMRASDSVQGYSGSGDPSCSASLPLNPSIHGCGAQQDTYDESHRGDDRYREWTP